MKQLREYFSCINKQGQITVNIGHISAKIELQVEVNFIYTLVEMYQSVLNIKV